MRYSFILMRYGFILVVSMLLGSRAIAQDSIRVQATLVTNKVFLKGWLEQFNTDKPMVLQFNIREGQVAFSLPASVQAGVYRMHLDTTNKKPFIDLIVDGIENKIVFDVLFNDLEARPVFHESIENQNWYNYLKSTTKQINRLDNLFQYLSVFHDKSIDKLVIKTYTIERDKYYKLFYKFCFDNTTTWASLLVENRPYYFSNLRKKPVERDYIRSRFFWEGIDTNNPKLINTPLYGELIELYFDKYFINPIENYTSGQKEYLLKKEMDILIEKFSNNHVSKAFIKNYLKVYFKRLGNQDLIDYVYKK